MSRGEPSHFRDLNLHFCFAPTVAVAVGDAGLAECGTHNCSLSGRELERRAR